MLIVEHSNQSAVTRKGRVKHISSSVFCILYSFLCILCCLQSIPAFAASDQQTIPLTFYIEPVRVVHAEAASGGPSVDLGAVVPGVDVPAQNVQVTVVTNTRSPYSLYHELNNEMTNQSGTTLAEDRFRYQVSNGTQGAQSQVPSWAPVPSGRALIAHSRGGSDTFMLQYSVQGQKVLEAGDYYGNAKITVEDA